MPPPLDPEKLAKLLGEDSKPSSDLLDYLESGAGKALSGAWSAVEPIFDILGRPQTALSEGIGAFRSGEENPFGAAWRGLSEGSEGAFYPSLGEQIVPVEEGEGFGRQALRFGADVATDPLNLLFGTGIGRGVVAKGLSGVVTPALGKVAKAAKAAPLAQDIARWTVPMSKVWGMFGDEAGKVGSALATEGFEVSRARLGQIGAEFADVLRRTGMDKADKQVREVVFDILEGRRPSSDAPEELVSFLRRNFEELGNEAEAVGLRMWDPKSGELVPFAKTPNYAPRMFKKGAQEEIDKFIQEMGPALDEDKLERIKSVQRKLSTPAGSKRAKRLAKEMNISESQAKDLIRQYAVRPRRVGHLEIARTDMPEELFKFLEKDPVEFFTKYVERVVPRLEMARRFGPEYEDLGKLLEASMDAGMSKKLAEDIGQVIKGVRKGSALGPEAEDWLRGATAIQAIGKLGPTTAIMNIGQQTNTLIREGTGNFLKSVGRQFSPSQRRQHISSYLGEMRGHLELLTGEQTASGPLGKVAQSWLKWAGFTPAERTNRIGASIAGLQSAEKYAREARALKMAGKKIPDHLAEKLAAYGVKDRHLAGMVDGRLPEHVRGLIGLKASEVTQHALSPWEMPAAWRTPEMRLFFQFKRFAYNQTRFLYDEVAKPAYKWLETNGKQGDIQPFLRALAVYPPAGMAVAEGRDAVRDLQAWFLGAKRRKKEDFDKHPTAAMLRNMMYVGSFGLAADVLDQAYRGGLEGYLLGPTIGDLTELTERATRAIYKAGAEGEYPTFEDLFLNFYRVAGRGALGVAPTELQTASTSRGAPMVAREALQNASRTLSGGP